MVDVQTRTGKSSGFAYIEHNALGLRRGLRLALRRRCGLGNGLFVAFGIGGGLLGNGGIARLGLGSRRLLRSSRSLRLGRRALGVLRSFALGLLLTRTLVVCRLDQGDA